MSDAAGQDLLEVVQQEQQALLTEEVGQDRVERLLPMSRTRSCAMVGMTRAGSAIGASSTR